MVARSTCDSTEIKDSSADWEIKVGLKNNDKIKINFSFRVICFCYGFMKYLAQAEGTVEKVHLECKSLLLRFLSWFGNWISRTNSVREFQFPHEQDGFSTRPEA
jgi:hypothetical protein